MDENEQVTPRQISFDDAFGILKNVYLGVMYELSAMKTTQYYDGLTCFRSCADDMNIFVLYRAGFPFKLHSIFAQGVVNQHATLRHGNWNNWTVNPLDKLFVEYGFMDVCKAFARIHRVDASQINLTEEKNDQATQEPDWREKYYAETLRTERLTAMCERLLTKLEITNQNIEIGE